jgi:DNA processing protein
VKEQELIDWITLLGSNKVGPVSFYKLLSTYGSAADSLKALAKKQQIATPAYAENILKKAERKRISLIGYTDDAYPKRLKALNDAPPILYAKGQIRLLQYPASIAVVGARNASVSGRKIASKIAYDLTQSQVLIISGMARGIDAASHKGALYANGQTGATVAVLGTGVDVPYPLENTDLYEQICVHGLVLSEYPPETQAQTNNFPRRNRIVSALSDGVIVVEASLNSGSLITARLGLEQGKDIFAVPGSPLEGRSAGANRLIKDGAVLIENAQDVLDVLKVTQNQQIKNYLTADLFETHLDKPQKNDDSRKKKDSNMSGSSLTDQIPNEGIDADELIRKSSLSATDAMVWITELELDGKIERRGSRLFIKKK